MLGEILVEAGSTSWPSRPQSDTQDDADGRCAPARLDGYVFDLPPHFGHCGSPLSSPARTNAHPTPLLSVQTQIRHSVQGGHILTLFCEFVMMGPLHRFSGPQHLDKLLAEARTAGVTVKRDSKSVSSEAFWFRRGFGLVHGSVGFGDDETVIYFGFGHPFNPLFWISDHRLLKLIERVFISNGTAVVDLNAIAEPSAAPNGGPATQLGNSGATEGPPSVS